MPSITLLLAGSIRTLIDSESSMNRKALYSIVLSLVLVGFLLSQVEIGHIFDSFRDIPPHLILAGFVLYAASYLLRAIRFRVLLQKDLSLGLLFNIVAVHTLWTNLLPFRSGELSYLYLLKKKVGARSYLSGMPSLILARVFDLAGLFSLYLFAFIGFSSFPEIFKKVSFILLALIFSLLLMVMVLVWKRERLLGKLKHYILKFNLQRVRLVEKMLGKGEEILEGFRVVKSKKALFLTAACSLAIWISVHLYTFAVIHAVGVDFTLWQVFFLSTLVILLSLFPIHGWAGFGTTEGIWVLIAIGFGLSKETAIVTGFQLHSIALFFVFFLGGIGYLLLSRCKIVVEGEV